MPRQEATARLLSFFLVQQLALLILPRASRDTGGRRPLHTQHLGRVDGASEHLDGAGDDARVRIVSRGGLRRKALQPEVRAACNYHGCRRGGGRWRRQWGRLLWWAGLHTGRPCGGLDCTWHSGSCGAEFKRCWVCLCRVCAAQNDTTAAFAFRDMTKELEHSRATGGAPMQLVRAGFAARPPAHLTHDFWPWRGCTLVDEHRWHLYIPGLDFE